ncbi:hypothetical protein [Rhodoferax sp. GW822-FHT02A01]|uniref:hypothetical protein n=1 Tax=Rhodoferax sp. GW822-FHT02A01 TaxID=3141537 RepID=UPI00315CE9E7
MKNPTLSKFVLALAASAALTVSTSALADDPVILTFATVGDSRQDPITLDPSQVAQGGVTAQDAKWLQNTKAWSRIMRTISSHKANLLFFNGDMVMGYGNGTDLTPYKTTNVGGVWTPANLPSGLTTDTTDFYAQYAFWRGLVANLFETGTYVVPVPGNHETQCKSCTPAKTAQPGNEAIWRDNMVDLILDNNRLLNVTGASASDLYYDANNYPKIGDKLANSEPAKTYSTSQYGLSYSFDFKGSHFAIVNTDAVGVDGRAPAVWLAADFAAAQARNPNVKLFVFGHKPAYTYKYMDYTKTPPVAITKLAGIDATTAKCTNPADGSVAIVATACNRDEFWKVIESNHATYFSGHEHIFNIQQPLGGSYQVLVGSGGSPFETSVTTNNPNDRKYAWAEVRVYQSGKVQVTAYGFDENYNGTAVLSNFVLPY